MSNPADKTEQSAYAPKPVRFVQQGRPSTAEEEFPRRGEQLSEREATRLLQSLDPEILAVNRLPWRAGWFTIFGGVVVAALVGAAMGMYFADGPTWRKMLGFTTEAKLDAPRTQERAITPAGTLSVASTALQPTNVAPSTSSVPIASATPQPPPAAGPPVASTAPQPTSAAPARIATVEAPSGGATTVRGVTNSEVRFGISAPFTGAAKELGNQMKLGIETAFNLANDAGGIDGRRVRLAVADDGYEPTRTAETMKQLFEKQQVFGFVGNVGTPTAVVALPFALERHALFFGAFTGADLLRRDPPDRYVFNYRASYAEETDAVVRYLVKMRHLRLEQIAVFAQQDSYGDAGFEGVAKAMRALRSGQEGAILRLNYKRNTVDVDDAVAQLRKQLTTIKAVVMVATYRAAAKFIEKTRDLSPTMIYTNVSFVGSTALAEELMLLGPKYATGVIVTQVVPAVDGYSSVILDYKSALSTYSPGEAPDY